ncbi:hypothetical protein QNH00_gp16 [Yersinia phage PYps16N]|uniref:Uncharacterized protein n=1 Tax=Yersinia phage PYps16N TaxID=2801354 RepID=A0AAE7P798_9CAUD|nr:hypothetical protein QNH00_gp16 [Yersinia phage PYps16N]QQO91189.1 hypothetical protein ORF016 [Yersinia phage PYps16N]
MGTKIVEIPANLVKPGDVLVYGNREYRIENILRFSNAVQLQYSGGYYNFEFGRIVKVLDRLPALGTPTIEFPNQINPVFLPVENVMGTLNIQNAIEESRILLQKLEQMQDLIQLAPTEDGKIAVGNTSIRVDKATVVKAARDEMKAAASKLAELIKKL